MAFSPYWSIFVPQLYHVGGVTRHDNLSTTYNSFNSVQLNFFEMDRHNEHNLTGQPGYGWDMTDKPFLTIREVADLLQVSNRTVYNLIY